MVSHHRWDTCSQTVFEFYSLRSLDGGLAGKDELDWLV